METVDRVLLGRSRSVPSPLHSVLNLHLRGSGVHRSNMTRYTVSYPSVRPGTEWTPDPGLEVSERTGPVDLTYP